MNNIVKTVIVAVSIIVLVMAVMVIGLVLDWMTTEAFKEGSVTALAIVGVVTLAAILLQLLAGFSNKK